MHTFGSLTINRDETDGGARGVDPLMGNAALCRWERTIAEERAGESPEGASCGIEEMEDETGRSESKVLSR